MSQSDLLWKVSGLRVDGAASKVVQGAALATVLFVGTILVTALYNLYLHPLRHYPGPKLWAAFRFPSSYYHLAGTMPKKILELHTKYGSGVIRISPNDLSFQKPGSFQEVMGHRKAGQQENDKEWSYRQFSVHNVVGAFREEHSAQRRALSAAFSAQAMANQQPLIVKYIDLFIQRMHENVGKKIDMVSWANWTTFDIIGDLAFGTPFGCLENSKAHFWIAFVFDSTFFQTMVTEVSRYPIVGPWLTRLVPEKFRKAMADRRAFTEQKVNLRVSGGEDVDRPDFLGAMLNKRETFSDAQLYSNADALVFAGSETTATTLAGTTFFLGKNPEIQDKLAQSIRDAFKSESEIDIHSVQKLDYLLAVLNESLRMYPPAPHALPRTAPKGGVELFGEFVPEGTGLHIYQWALFRNPKLWADADKFVPERWLGKDPRYANDSLDSMQAFSYGPRNCIGKNLAYTEMRIIMARLLFNFEISLVDNEKIWTDEQSIFLLWDKNPLEVVLKPRPFKN